MNSICYCKRTGMIWFLDLGKHYRNFSNQVKTDLGAWVNGKQSITKMGMS